MIAVPAGAYVWIAAGRTDMRKGFYVAAVSTIHGFVGTFQWQEQYSPLR